MSLTRALGIAVMALLACLAVSAPAGEQDDVKAKLNRESDPVKRSRMQLRLAELDLEAATRLYAQGTVDQGLAKLQDMLSLIVQVEEELFKTGRDPRKKPKGFKETEIKLREFQRHLEDLRVTVPVDEREPIDKILARIADIHERFLNGLMRVKKE